MRHNLTFEELKQLHSAVFPNGQLLEAPYTTVQESCISNYCELFVLLALEYNGARTMLKQSDVHGNTYVSEGDLINWATEFYLHVHFKVATTSPMKPGPLAGIQYLGEFFNYYHQFLKQRLFPKLPVIDNKVPVDAYPGILPIRPDGYRSPPSHSNRDDDDGEWNSESSVREDIVDEIDTAGNVASEDQFTKEADKERDESPHEYSEEAVAYPVTNTDLEKLKRKYGCIVIGEEYVLSESDRIQVDNAAKELFNTIKQKEKKILILGVWAAFYLNRDSTSTGKFIRTNKYNFKVVETRWATTYGYAKETARLDLAPNANNAGCVIDGLGVEHDYIQQHLNPRTVLARFFARKGWAPSAEELPSNWEDSTSVSYSPVGGDYSSVVWKILIRKAFIGDLSKLAFYYLTTAGYTPITSYANETRVTEETSDEDTQP